MMELREAQDRVENRTRQKRKSDRIKEPEVRDEKVSKTPSESESCADRVDDPVKIGEPLTLHPSHLPARHYDVNTAAPISYALKSLEELLSWRRSDANRFNIATALLEKRQPSLQETHMRTLVSHDMMGGYLHDRFIQGAEVDDPYVFYHWDYIDIFNYFSHHMVTIPPAVWTNSAHRHAVLSLGTFITEWVDGERTCERFLLEEEKYRSVADKLVQIAHCYGFDGWLINIENQLSATAVRNLVSFLRYLTEQMHERVPGSQVIWYDSVLEDGSLKWQNQLNNSNRVFFEVCDGMFTNYNWTESSLEDMVADAAGRLRDVYVGIDVFARGQVVGGKFDTDKALQLVRKHGFSTAIFAPGWVYECHAKPDFHSNQNKFWGLLSDVLFPHHSVVQLPFYSSFCQGFGRSFYWRGEVQDRRSWVNLSAQQLQPLYLTERWDGGWFRMRGCSEEVWIGGGALLLEGVMPKSQPHISARIFSLNLSLTSEVLISMVFQASRGVNVSLELRTSDAALCSGERPLSSVTPVMLDEDDERVRHFNQTGDQRACTWINKWFQVQQVGCVLNDVLLLVSRDQSEGGDVEFCCRVGDLMIVEAESLLQAPPLIHTLRVYDVGWREGGAGGKRYLSVTLHWRYPLRLVRFFRVFWRRPGEAPSLIGRSYGGLYRVVELEVEQTDTEIELLVEPLSYRGVCVPQDQWERQTLNYTQL